MKIYRWDSVEQKFTAGFARDDASSTEAVMIHSLQISKGQRLDSTGVDAERMICLLRGSCRMTIAGDDLIVRRNEGVVIPSGVNHSAEAIQDSFAVQMDRAS
ncbi:MAG TPA: hypothetical protein VJX67_17225 [Blastocatellia bacterium]|nr:hypothetical protein [Blastocatellia bacterium]